MLDVIVDEVLDLRDETADDLETPTGAVYDREGGDDVLSLDPDAVALALSYQYDLQDTIDLGDDTLVGLSYQADLLDVVVLSDVTFIDASYQYNLQDVIVLTDALSVDTEKGALLSDVISVTDQLTIETTFNTDTISVSDQTLVSLVYGLFLSDTLATTDIAARGLELVRASSDAVALTDQTDLAAAYSISASDTVIVTDVIHPWMTPDFSILIAILEGLSNLQAVLMKRKAASALPNPVPPRITPVAGPPKEIAEHFVVNPNPPRRRDDR